MANEPIKQDLIQQIASSLEVSIDDVNAVVYGERPVRSDKLLAIIDSLARQDGRGGVYVCAVWKGSALEKSVRNLPRYDYFGQILEGLNLYLYQKGYTSQLLVSNLLLADESYFEYIISRRPTAGWINIASHSGGHLRRTCAAHQRPLVFLDYPAGEDQSNQYIITLKSEAVIAEVVEYLYRLGHRRIAFVQGPQEKQSAIDRYNGYRVGLAAMGIALDLDLVCAGNWDVPAGKEAAEHFLALASPPTAIIASNDLMAFGVMQGIEQLGLKIPDDVSVVGFDDIALASMTNPPLTSIRTSMTEMGYRAAEYIVKLLEGETLAPQQLNVPLEMVIRGSTGPAKAGG